MQTAGYGRGLVDDALQERGRRKKAEKVLKQVTRERDGLAADLDLIRKECEEDFAAERKRLEDQVKEVVTVADFNKRSLEDAHERIRLLEANLKTTQERLAEIPSPADVIRDYKTTPRYETDLENHIEAFRKSSEFRKIIGAERRKITPLVMDCCREFFKDGLHRPGSGFETFFTEWMRVRQGAQAP